MARTDRLGRLAMVAAMVLATSLLALLVLGGRARAATLTVTKTTDTNDGVCDSDCSLREAISVTNSNGQTDTVGFAPGASGTITLTGGALQVANDAQDPDLSILGPGAGVLTVSGNNQSRVFEVNSGAKVAVGGLTVSGGKSTQGGGGIYNAGRLTLTNATVSDNDSDEFGGGIYNDDGTLTLKDSTVSDNVGARFGGGIVNFGIKTTLIRSTVSSNTLDGSTATRTGGGINNGSGSTLEVINSTISANTTASGQSSGRGGAIANFGGTVELTNATLNANQATEAANLYNLDGTITIKNTVVANPQGGGANCAGSGITSQGHNLEYPARSCGFTATGDIQNQDPLLLDRLRGNGGPTQTHALLSGSPAIDAAANTGCPNIDQRGVARPQDGDNYGRVVCDIGAFERDVTRPKVTVVRPANKARGVKRYTNLRATFSEQMDRSTLAKSTFKLFKVDSNGVSTRITAVKVRSSADGLKDTLDPFGTSSTLLKANTKYKAVVTIGAKDLSGNALDQNPSKGGKQQKVWTFTTGRN